MRSWARKGADGLRRGFSSLFLLCCAVALACALLGGAQRLIASDASAQPQVAAAPVRAVLGAPEEGKAEMRGAPGQDAPRFAAQAPRPVQGGLPKPPLAARDANGNVLRAPSYLRAVYQAFALGDGFA